MKFKYLLQLFTIFKCTSIADKAAHNTLNNIYKKIIIIIKIFPVYSITLKPARCCSISNLNQIYPHLTRGRKHQSTIVLMLYNIVIIASIHKYKHMGPR